MPIETLHKNEWLTLLKMVDPERHVDGYVYSHESRCGGVIVAVLPYRRTAPLLHEYLLRAEVTPCWSMLPTHSTVTGGREDAAERPLLTAVRELQEETGFIVPADSDRWGDLGSSRASKSADTVYELFSVDVTGLEPGEIMGDRTYHDTNAPSVWTTRPWESPDPQASVMWARFVNPVNGGTD